MRFCDVKLLASYIMYSICFSGPTVDLGMRERRIFETLILCNRLPLFALLCVL